MPTRDSSAGTRSARRTLRPSTRRSLDRAPGPVAARDREPTLGGRALRTPQQRRELLQILTPHDPRMLPVGFSECMCDAVGGEELVKAARAGQREIVRTAPDPQQIELLVYLLGVGRNVLERFLRIVAAGTEHAEAAEQIQVAQTDAERLAAAA